jgi:hypothetical protein
LVGGLTPSQQSFLTNFSTPSGSAATNVTPAQQMNSNAQANANSALSNNTPFSTNTPTAPITGNVTGTANISGTSTGGLGTSTTTTIAPAPIVNPPIANNPGTLAETMQPATP